MGSDERKKEDTQKAAVDDFIKSISLDRDCCFFITSHLFGFCVIAFLLNAFVGYRQNGSR